MPELDGGRPFDRGTTPFGTEREEATRRRDDRAVRSGTEQVQAKGVVLDREHLEP
jgi:hypothetical protein